MGLGAAVHMSSVAEPAELLMKHMSVIDALEPLPLELITAAKLRLLNEEILSNTTMLPWCHEWLPSRHVSTLASHKLRLIIWKSLPFAIREHPLRYPFMLPLPMLEHLQMEKYDGDDYDDMRTKKYISNSSNLILTSAGEAVKTSESKLLYQCGLPEWIIEKCKSRKHDFEVKNEDIKHKFTAKKKKKIKKSNIFFGLLKG
jgi:hypothetical protein